MKFCFQHSDIRECQPTGHSSQRMNSSSSARTTTLYTFHLHHTIHKATERPTAFWKLSRGQWKDRRGRGSGKNSREVSVSVRIHLKHDDTGEEVSSRSIFGQRLKTSMMNDLQCVHYEDERAIQQETWCQAQGVRQCSSGCMNCKWSPGRIVSRVGSNLHRVKTEKKIVRRHGNQIRGRPTKEALNDLMTTFDLPNERPKTLEKEKKLWKQRRLAHKNPNNHNNRRHHR